MKFISAHKRMAVVSLVVAVVLATGGAAYAYFTSTGSGSGSASTGRSAALTISQVGAGYDSLVSTNTYNEDQCMSGCTGPSEIGNDITLAGSGYQQLVNVVVAIDNWGPAVSGVPMTLTISNTADGPISDTQDFSFPAAINLNTDPSETNVTFDFTSQGAFVNNEFVYGITFAPTAGAASVPAAGALNVALSSSANDLSVGTDTSPGSIYLDDTNNNNNDFPVCTNASFPTSGFVQVTTDGCAAQEYYAYGTPAQVAAGNDDIPAVEVNVVGGSVTGLYPGDPAQPIEYAITNPGTNAVQVQSVTASVDTAGSGDVLTPSATDVTNCKAAWYQINNSPQTLGGGSGVSVAPGTTLFTTNSPIATTLSIQMLNPAVIQDACEGADVGLSFSSN